MEIFNLTLQQMLMMFSLMAAGFVLRKLSALPDNAYITMSKLETFLFVPALNLYAQMTKCTVKTFSENYTLMLYGLATLAAGMALAYPLSRLFIRKASGDPEREYQRNIYKYAMTFGNYGFMGNFIVLCVFGADMFYKYSLFTFFINIVCNSWGPYILIPKDKGASVWANIRKGLLTPPTVSLVVGIILGLLNVGQYMPEFLASAMNEAGKCQGPVAMVLAGFVIGGYRFGSLISDKKLYIASALRLIVIPSAMMLVMKALGLGDEVMTLALITFATPLGLNTIVFPSAYGGDPKTGASMAMISSTLSVATIPLMYLLFIVLL